MQPHYLSPTLSWAIALTAPYISLLLAQIFIRSGWDFQAALDGLGIAGEFFWPFFVICKLILPWPRPYFLSICEPVQPLIDKMWQALPEFGRTSTIPLNIEVCRDASEEAMTENRYDELRDALTGFPSGRVCTLWIGAWFMTLYLNGKLKTFDSTTSITAWRVLLNMTPFATASALTVLCIEQGPTGYDTNDRLVLLFFRSRMRAAGLQGAIPVSVQLPQQSSTDRGLAVCV
ncbi:MAG: hypothetical protein Q9213_006274 [Squamulea squamosa]